ncbi:MAG: PKD domain-containing protein, partial [Candidatus Thorarchaeota archaeon]
MNTPLYNEGSMHGVRHYVVYEINNYIPIIDNVEGGTTVQGQSITLHGSGHDVDGDGIMRYEWDSDYDGVSFNADYFSSDPIVTYDTPGLYTVAFRMTDDLYGVSSIQTATVEVLPANNAPLAHDDAASTDEDTSVVIDVLANDSDIDGDTLTIDSVGSASYGTVQITTGLITYSPDANYFGIDSFTYTVSDGNGGIATATVTVTMNPVNDVPVANIGGPYSANEGTQITFVASGSTDLDGDMLQFRWDFDDDETWDTVWSTASTATHTWYDDYSGIVTVEVTDGEFFVTDSSTVTVYNVAPSVDIGADLETVEGYTITFTSTVIDPGSDTLNYEWDFGDGSPVSAVPSHQYADNGVYTVTLTVIDDDDDCGTDTLRVTVNNAAPIVNVWGTQVVGEGGTASFIGHFLDPGQQDTHTVVWNFGDGSDPVEGTLTPKHTYGDNGVYQVSFTVTDDDGASSMDTITVTVLNVAPTVDVGIDKTAYEGDTVFFTGTYTDPGWLDTHTIVWYFGDGSDPVEGTFTPDHVYGDNGVYTVTLTVTDDDGASSMDTITVTVQNVAPTVDAGADRTANEGDTVVFAGNYYDPGQMDTHTIVWDFGDGSDPVEGTLTPEHVYADNGVYTITLTVTDDDEGMSSDTLTVTVLNVAPTAIAGPDQ